ncbi:HD domain-containing protein [Candidatus Pacearchaeota archaeon]|nr:HD domain-containing protein [Candidatus Pacearchaeota archaeon]
MEKYTKKQPINTINENDVVEDIFVVKIKKSIRPYTKGYSFDLILSDSSGGSLEYKYWGGPNEEEVKAVFNSILPDSVVFITGRAGKYNNKMQISANDTNQLKVLTPEEYEANFIRGPKKDVELMYTKLMEKANSIEDPAIKSFVLEILGEFEDKLKIHPGAIMIHHAWKGGLVQHILEIIEYCETSSELFSELDRDILIAGALLHDIGKLEEIEATTRLKGSRKGQLISHLVIGVNYLAEKLKNSSIDELKKEKLLHVVLTHHGKIEHGSPKPPMIPEAFALYYADELSSKLSEIVDFVEEHKNKTEDDFMFSRRHGSNIFLR